MLVKMSAADKQAMLLAKHSMSVLQQAQFMILRILLRSVEEVC